MKPPRMETRSTQAAVIVRSTMRRIFDPSFRYTPSYETDIRKTFERIRSDRRAREIDGLGSSAHKADQNILRLDSRKSGTK